MTAGSSEAPKTPARPGKIRVAVISTANARGGAGRAANRLHHAFRADDRLSSTMLVAPGRNRTGDPTVECVDLADVAGLRLRARWAACRRIAWNRWRNRFRPRGYEPFQDDREPDGYALEPHLADVDVLHLNWVARFLPIEAIPRLAERVPLLWTLHDMLPFTGGCHYDHGCDRWRDGCGACPQLGSSKANDASATNWRRKSGAFAAVPEGRLRLVTPSRWLAEQARSSPSLRRFPITVIPNAIDLERYRPRDRRAGRAALGLPEDRRLLLFVADDLSSMRKGGRFLGRAMAELADVGAVDLVAVGGGRAPIDHPRVHRLGVIDDEDRLASVFAAVDLFILPSLQDNLPNTMLESLAAATPVVAFDVGGIPDFVRPGETGALAPCEDGEALALAAKSLLAHPEQLAILGRNGRRLVERECSACVAAERYHREFSTLIEPHSAHAEAA
ncbi:MAG: glycosyltransferase [Alphaproteobacteria bacterium]|nr:glycosyltransferase [Alphaproteobacteria bacterium]